MERKLVYSLAIDMIESTTAGLKMTSAKLERFNRALVEQIKPHVTSLQLSGVLIKFTGDGWLLMTDHLEYVPAFCSLATIMASRFQAELSEKTGIESSAIPALRLAICSGGDAQVELPDGRSDWVGDSARRSIRALGVCSGPNQILVNDTIRQVIFRDFDISRINIAERRSNDSNVKFEEDFELYQLGNLRAEVAEESQSPECYVYALSAMGRTDEANRAAEKTVDIISQREARELPQGVDEQQLVLRSWNRLLASLDDYRQAADFFRRMRPLGVKPDHFTYGVLINKAPDYDTALGWYEQMERDGVQPNIVSVTPLVVKASSFRTAMNWVDDVKTLQIAPDIVFFNALLTKAISSQEVGTAIEAMRAADVAPDTFTYNIMIDKSIGYEEAVNCFARMVEERVDPDAVTFRTLMARAPTLTEAQTWFERMVDESIPATAWAFNTLISKTESVDQGRDLMRRMEERGLKPDVWTFNTLIDKAPSHAIAAQMYEAMTAANVAPDLVTFNTLLKSAPDLRAAEIWLQRLREAGLTQDEFTESSLRKIQRKSFYLRPRRREGTK